MHRLARGDSYAAVRIKPSPTSLPPQFRKQFSLRSLASAHDIPNTRTQEFDPEEIEDDGVNTSMRASNPSFQTPRKQYAHLYTEQKMKVSANNTMGDRVEHEMNLSKFRQLMKQFRSADVQKRGGLDIDEFRSAFGRILGEDMSEEEVDIHDCCV